MLRLPVPFVGDPQIQKNLEAISLAIHQPVPQARVYNDANIQIADNTATALTFNSERFDDGSLHSTAANTSRLTAPVTGLYMIGGNVHFASNATGFRQVEIRLNGTTAIANQRHIDLSTDEPILNISTIWRLAATDYVELMAYQNSGGNLNVLATSAVSPEFWMVRLAGYAGEQFSRT